MFHTQISHCELISPFARKTYNMRHHILKLIQLHLSMGSATLTSRNT